MKKRSAKKLVAQALYYGGNGTSPLVRDVLDDDFNKPPVHQRLGLKQQNRVKILGTNTAFIGPKKRDFRKIATNRTFKQTGDAGFANITQCFINIFRVGGHRNQRNQKVTRVFTAQNRLQRIRSGFVPSNKQNVLQPQVQRIRLRRATSAPKNYTVRVPNTVADFNSFTNKHSIKKELNSRFQNEIKIIQQQHGRSEPLDFSEPLVVSSTSKTLHHRFSLLP